MRVKGDSHFVLESGKMLYCYALTIGMNDHMLLTYGHDGVYEPIETVDDEERGDYTPEDAVEVADYMIDLWNRFKSYNKKRIGEATK